jgi:hypothetical protein
MAMNYTVVAQSRDEMLQPGNAPSLTIWPYLIETSQEPLLRAVSIYTDKGTSREQARIFYMNAIAMELWRAMGRTPTVVGERHRPPMTSVLSFGVPFSE